MFHHFLKKFYCKTDNAVCVPVSSGWCSSSLYPVIFACKSSFICLFIYYFLNIQVYFNDLYLYSVLLSQSVSKVCPQSLQACQENFVSMMSYTLMRACMFDHSSEAAIIAAYFRLA